MELTPLTSRPDSAKDEKFNSKFAQLKKLLSELSKHSATNAVVESINKEIVSFNQFQGSIKQEINQLGKAQKAIVQIAEKQLKLVPIGYYRNLWLALGIGAFGIPIGVAIGVATKNMGLLGLGLPIGMAMGLGVGTGMDKKAKESGRQLDIEIKN